MACPIRWKSTSSFKRPVRIGQVVRLRAEETQQRFVGAEDDTVGRDHAERLRVGEVAHDLYEPADLVADLVRDGAFEPGRVCE